MISTQEWQNRVVLITGGAGGMGRAIAGRFLSAGATVALSDINESILRAAAAEMGAGAHCIKANVASVADCERMIAEALAISGRLDLLVNGAGVWVEGQVDEMTEEDWDRVIDINLKGTFFACRYAVPALEKSSGQIINVGSDAGLIGNAGAAIYCASKGGVTVMTKALALELAPRGIRVNAICPCDVETPMLEYQAMTFGAGDPQGYRNALLSKYPQGQRARFATAEEVAEFVYLIASPKLAPVTGACLSIDFGLTAGH